MIGAPARAAITCGTPVIAVSCVIHHRLDRGRLTRYAHSMERVKRQYNVVFYKLGFIVGSTRNSKLKHYQIMLSAITDVPSLAQKSTVADTNTVRGRPSDKVLKEATPDQWFVSNALSTLARTVVDFPRTLAR